MKRTKWAVAVRQTSTATIYRIVMTDGERYFIKDEGQLYDVTDMKDRFHDKRFVR